MSTAEPKRLRMFFAVLPDESGLTELETAAGSLQLPGEARLVRRENWHMTVAFIGEVDAGDIGALQAIGAAQRARPFTVRFDAYEYWPKPEVIVAAARIVPAALTDFWQGLHARLAVHGWALNAKKLRPHVTLAKRVGIDPVLPTLRPFEWAPHKFCLMGSRTGAPQPTYTVVAAWPLLDKMRAHE